MVVVVAAVVMMAVVVTMMMMTMLTMMMMMMMTASCRHFIDMTVKRKALKKGALGVVGTAPVEADPVPVRPEPAPLALRRGQGRSRPGEAGRAEEKRSSSKRR